MDLTHQKRFMTYGGNYSTYVRTKLENETNWPASKFGRR